MLPCFPLEVAEHIIDHLNCHVDSLRNCALTCGAWLPRARYHLVESIRIGSTEEFSPVLDYFDAHPRMTRFVKQISIGDSIPLEAVSVGFLMRFPNLRSCKIRGKLWAPPICFHPTTLVRVKRHLLLEKLCLQCLDFQSKGELARLISALPHLQHLECTDVRLRSEPTSAFPADVWYRGKCRMLSHVTVRCNFKLEDLCGSCRYDLTLVCTRYR